MLNFVMTEFSEVRLVRVLEMKFDYMRKTRINAHQLALKADVHPSLVYRFTRRGARACSATSAYKLA